MSRASHLIDADESYGSYRAIVISSLVVIMGIFVRLTISNANIYFIPKELAFD